MSYQLFKTSSNDIVSVSRLAQSLITVSYLFLLRFQLSFRFFVLAERNVGVLRSQGNESRSLSLATETADCFSR